MRVLLSNESDVLLKTLDFLYLPVLIVDERRKIIALNSTARGVFGYSLDDLRGQDLAEIVSLPRPGNWTSRTGALPPGPALPPQLSAGLCCESLCRQANGETFSANAVIIPHPREGGEIIVIQDISHQRKLQQRATQRTKELAVFNTFAKILISTRSSEAILQETVDMFIALLGADRGCIYQVDEQTQHLSLTVHRNFTRAACERAGLLRPGEGLCGKVLTSGRPLLVKRASEDPRVLFKEEGVESIAGAPILSSQGAVVGVLAVSSRKPAYFTSMDMQLLAVVGKQLGVALENARLIARLRDKMRQIELINELSGIINSSLSIGTVFRIMVSEIKKLVDYDRASLLFFNERDNNLIIFALDTDMHTILKKGVTAPLATTSAGWVIQNNRPWINYDLLEEIRFPLDMKLLNEGIRSTISIPLFRDKMLGVFNLDSTAPARYSEKDLEILLPVAKHITIACENAFLFEEISKEKKEWESTFDAIADMVWIEDDQQHIRRVNKTLLLTMGVSAVDLMGRPSREILRRIGISTAECPCADTVAAKRPSFVELRGAGGSIYYFWAYPLIDSNGRLYATVHYLKDVTAQKRLEQQLIRTDKMASLGTLAAGIAHEINNPLGIIAGYAEALLDRTEDRELLAHAEFEDFPEYLQTIHNEIFRCKRILGSLLDFSRPPAGTFREIDINELIKEVILLLNHKAARLKHRMELRLNRDLPKITAEPGSLRQLFMNIVMNSMYFTPENGSILITSERDDAGRGGAPPWITVSIADTGQGIAPEIIDQIFDPFFTTKPVGDGTGLGLAICHKIVQDHGGTIDVASDRDRGTTFIIKIPAKTTP